MSAVSSLSPQSTMSDPAQLFIALYTDEDVTSELAPALRERGFEAQSAAEAGLLQSDDAQQLAYAATHGPNDEQRLTLSDTGPAICGGRAIARRDHCFV
jgi:hypothetical protein